MAIYHPVFGRFSERITNAGTLSSSQFSAQDLANAHHLLSTATQFYESETAQLAEMRQPLNALLQGSLVKKVYEKADIAPGAFAGTTADGALSFGRQDGVDIDILLLEMKPEVGVGRAEPTMQAGFTALKIFSTKKVSYLVYGGWFPGNGFPNRYRGSATQPVAPHSFSPSPALISWFRDLS